MTEPKAKSPYSDNTNWPCHKKPDGKGGYFQCSDTCPDLDCQFRDWLDNNCHDNEVGQ